MTMHFYSFIAVAIFGDTTSDEVTENDDVQVPIITPISTAQHLSSSRPSIRCNGNK